MFFNTILICLSVVLGQVSAELVLEKDVLETITFDGSELVIEVDNSGGIQGYFTLCIKTTDQDASRGCPTGYGEIHVNFGRNPDVKTAKINRQGKVMLGPLKYDTITSILFNENESLDVILKEVPDQSTKVRLLNAERYVPPESTTTTTEKNSKSATIGTTVGVVVGVIVVIIAIAAIVGICIYCRKKKQMQAVPPPVIVVQKATVEKRDPSPKASNKTKETTKKTSQEPLTTPSQPQVPAPKAAPKPQSPATVPTAAKSLSTQKPPTPSAEPVPPPSAEPASAPPIVNSTEPTKEDAPSSKPDKNKSLKVEKTQTETPPSPPTPRFGNDPASRAMSENSAFKEKANLAFNQTANVNKKKYKFKKCDELLGYELLSENITCYGMRFGRLDKHENFVIRLRCKCRPHDVDDMEKAILKRTKEVAVDAADVLIEHLKKELAAYGFEPQSGLQQPDRLWKHIDEESTMTSLFYLMMILVKPDLFKVQRQGVHDKDVEVMPVSMLYCLILDQRNSKKFREDIVILLRLRSTAILQQAPKDSLREAAFPLHYQALLRMKNPQSYIEGRSAKTKSMM